MKFSFEMSPVYKHKFVIGENNAYLFVFPRSLICCEMRFNLNLPDPQTDHFWIIPFQVHRNYGLLRHSKDSM
jgi:hypothetical protein